MPAQYARSSLVVMGVAAALLARPGLPAAASTASTAPVPLSAAAHAAAEDATRRPAPGPGSTGLLATPLLSPARLPRALQYLWAQRDLAGALAAAMSPSALGATASGASCAEVVEDGRVIYQDHARLEVIPASNMKLLTATALLKELGPGYVFTTSVLAAAPPVGGVVEGDLYLVGGGDPLLRLPRYVAGIPGGRPVFTNFTALVGRLKAAGVREVTGSVVGDDSRYDSERSVASWPSSYVAQGDVGPISALGVDDGFAVAGGAVPDSAPPAVQSAGVLTTLLRTAGARVAGPPLAGPPPAGAIVLARLASPPLTQVLGEVLRESDNTAMELMTKELGLRQMGQGTTAAGVAAVRADLKTMGLPVAGLVGVDGSGLSRSDRVTCALLVSVLQRAGPDGLLVRALPVAGRSGTLAGQLKGTVAAGRVLAKTGTLDGVKALSGWVEPAPGQGLRNPELRAPVVFSAVLNRLPLNAPDPAGLTDRVVLDIAKYPRAPVLASFEPG